MTRAVLNPQVLYAAYTQGYFPMPDEKTGDIRWYRPDPRAILPLDGFHQSSSLRKTLSRGHLRCTINRAFPEVMRACADRERTWITEEFVTVFTQLHRVGAAQSVEVWCGDTLAGGVYGVNFGGAFFAESMFHYVTDASKVALLHLVEALQERRFALLECQFLTPHLASLGAIEIPDRDYMRLLRRAVAQDVYF